MGEENNIKITPLGIRYLDGKKANDHILYEYVDDTIILDIKKEKKQVSKQEEQKLSIQITESVQGDPISDIATRVTLLFPDNTEKIFYPEPTDANGKTTLITAPAPQLENGSIVSYEVCLLLSSQESICKSGSYLFWNES